MMNETKKQLLKDLSAYFELSLNFPPLTSKVYAYILLDCGRKGVTFDELTATFKASKSSISNSLGFLTQIKEIEYFSKIEDRKRLYRIVPYNITLRLQKIQDMLTKEKNLARRIREYKLEITGKADDPGILKSNIYTEHLELAIEQLENTIEKLKSIT